MGMELDWVGKYFLGASALYLATAPGRAKKKNAREALEQAFMKSFQDFPVQDAARFLRSQRWKPSQIPCYFQQLGGQVAEFVYEPDKPEALAGWQMENLEAFINLYGFKELQPALMLSRDGARDEAICFIWDVKTSNSYIDQVSNVKRLLGSI